DSYDAMTTLRVYKNARLPHEALAELQAGAGRMYDPVLVKAFVNCMGIFPIGSAVTLQGGEIAVVSELGTDPELLHQPQVKVVMRDGQRLAAPEQLDLSLPEASSRQIEGYIDPQPLGIDCSRY